MLSCLTWCSWTLFFDFLSRHELYASPCTLLCPSSLRSFASGLATVPLIILPVDCFYMFIFGSAVLLPVLPASLSIVWSRLSVREVVCRGITVVAGQRIFSKNTSGS